MATLVTVTCDRCGSIIPDGSKGTIGHVQVFISEHYDDVMRSSWELCRSCAEHLAERIGDIAGVPANDWRRPEPIDKDEMERVMQGRYPAHDPIAVAQRVLEGEGIEDPTKLPEWQQASF